MKVDSYKRICDHCGERIGIDDGGTVIRSEEWGNSTDLCYDCCREQIELLVAIIESMVIKIRV